MKTHDAITPGRDSGRVESSIEASHRYKKDDLSIQIQGGHAIATHTDNEQPEHKRSTQRNTQPHG